MFATAEMEIWRLTKSWIFMNEMKRCFSLFGIVCLRLGVSHRKRLSSMHVGFKNPSLRHPFFSRISSLNLIGCSRCTPEKITRKCEDLIILYLEKDTASQRRWLKVEYGISDPVRDTCFEFFLKQIGLESSIYNTESYIVKGQKHLLNNKGSRHPQWSYVFWTRMQSSDLCRNQPDAAGVGT